MFLNFRNCTRILFQKQPFLTLTKSSIKSWSIVFFGNDNYSLHCLKKLVTKKEEKVIKNLEVVSTNKLTCIYNYAIENNLKTHIWPPKLSKEFDLGIVVSFGKFIPNTIIDCFSLGVINVHASLLPKYKGGMPIAHALKNGDKETGVSIIKINSKIDSGDIILKRAIPIGENEVYPSLHTRLTHLGANCLIEVIDGMPECLDKSVSQSKEKGSYAKIIKKDAKYVNWSKMTATEVYNLYRALYSLFTLKTTWHGQDTYLICMSLNNTGDEFKENTEPGTVKYNKKNQCLIVQCKDKCIQLCTVKVKHKLYTAEQFNRGFISTKDSEYGLFGT